MSLSMSANHITVAIIQQGIDKHNAYNKAANLRRSVKAIEEAAKQGAQLVLLQELHTTYYFCQTEDAQQFELAEPLDGQTVQTLAKAAKANNIVIVGSIFENRKNITYHNTAVVLDSDGSLAGYYRKMHIPDDPGFYEKFYFTPGDAQTNDGASGFSPIQTSLGKLGLLICWDQWYPEAARIMALKSADMLLYPTAIGWDLSDSKAEQKRQQDAWITIQRAHAVANNLPVIVANRTGFEVSPDAKADNEGIQFWGHSFICGQQGEYLAQASSDTEAIILAKIDIKQTQNVRRIWPYFRDRRIDAYTDILKLVDD